MLSLIAGLVLFAPAPQEPTTVTYSTPAEGVEMKMDLYQPERKNGERVPAVVVVHGGAWMTGNRKDMASLAQNFAKEGFLAASVSYRLAPRFKWPAMLDDVQTAVRYLRSNAEMLQIDPNRIGAAGASAGGHLSLLLGFRETRDPGPKEFPGVSSRVSVVFNIFGPTDMRRDFPTSLDGMFELVLGQRKAEASETIRLASPVEWITKDDAPVFTVHGEKDPLVPVAQARWLKEVLDKNGITNEMVIVPGMVHSINLQDQAQMKAIVDGTAFLKKHLSKTATGVR